MRNSSGMALISNDNIPETHDDNTGFEDLYASAISDRYVFNDVRSLGHSNTDMRWHTDFWTCAVCAQ